MESELWPYFIDYTLDHEECTFNEEGLTEAVGQKISRWKNYQIYFGENVF